MIACQHRKHMFLLYALVIAALLQSIGLAWLANDYLSARGLLNATAQALFVHLQEDMAKAALDHF